MSGADEFRELLDELADEPKTYDELIEKFEIIHRKAKGLGRDRTAKVVNLVILVAEFSRELTLREVNGGSKVRD